MRSIEIICSSVINCIGNFISFLPFKLNYYKIFIYFKLELNIQFWHVKVYLC